jgi:hypothetical protein
MAEPTAILRPSQLVVVVVKPSGAPVDKADVSVTWEKTPAFPETPAAQTAKTGTTGRANLGVIEPADGSATVGSVEVKRRCHGPVVERGQPFKLGPATVKVRLTPAKLELLDVPSSDLVRWGQPRWVRLTIDKKPVDALEITLVEAGHLGVEHPTIPTRRLSSVQTPESTAKPLSQVDEELLFHIAHGDLALTRVTDLTFKHTSEDTDCANGSCEFVPPSSNPVAQDPTFSPSDLDLGYTPKLSVRNEVMGGLRYVQLVGASTSKLTLGFAQTQDLNPRNVVGATRLGRLMSERHKVRVMLTAGFLRTYQQLKDLDPFNQAVSEGKIPTPPEAQPELGKYKRDAHGRGRGVDISGLLMDHPPDYEVADGVEPKDPASPHARRKKGGAKDKPLEAEKAFSVFLHWGKLPLRFRDAKGEQRVSVSSKSSVEFKSELSTGAANDARPEILYRLDAPWDSSDPKDLPERSPGLEMTPAHYKLAKVLFEEVYAFFVREYSCRESRLGPVDRAFPEKEQSQARADDAGGVNTTPGAIGGRVLHPDTPDKDQRGAHQDHIHANLGHNGPGKKNFDMWFLTEKKTRESLRTNREYER